MGAILFKELRARARSPRTVLLLTFYLVLLAGLSFLYFRALADQPLRGGAQAAATGRAIFTAIVTVELLLVCFLTPSFTAGLVAGERERQTLDLLITTPIRSYAIVFGKLVAALAVIILLIVTAVPVQSVAFMLGGVDPLQIATASVLLLVTALAFGALGLLSSAVMRTSLAATVLAYALILALVLGAGFLRNLTADTPAARYTRVLAYLDPFSAVGSALGIQDFELSARPPGRPEPQRPFIVEAGPAGARPEQPAPGMRPGPGAVPRPNPVPVPPVVRELIRPADGRVLPYYLGAYLGITGLSLVFSARLLRQI